MRLAVIQCDARYGEPKANADRAIAFLEQLSDQRVDLAVFPEAYLTGYVASSREEAMRLGIPLMSDHLERIGERCKDLGIAACIGFCETIEGGISNSAVLLGLDQPGLVYRKTHLPFLGLDHFTTPGNQLPVWETPWGRIGVLICFDLRLPEPARTLAMQGADLILLPTNWPEGAEMSPQMVAPVRAVENRVFLACADRCDSENGTRFIGMSCIYDPYGRAIAMAGTEEVILTADIDLMEAREKRLKIRPGYEQDTFSTRQPELYGPLLDRWE